METWKAVSTMRAVRSFADRPLDPKHLDRILRAGRRAPSSKNSQRWAFVVCQGRARLRRLSSVGMYAQHLANAAAGIALVAPADPDAGRRESIMLDLGQAAQNMMLAAWDLGIGSVHASVYDEPEARELLGYPEDHRCDYILSFGYPADPSMLTAPPARGGRRALAEIVHHERWLSYPEPSGTNHHVDSSPALGHDHH
jgi:nitroreductase